MNASPSPVSAIALSGSIGGFSIMTGAEDLRNTTMGAKNPEFTEEEIVSETVYEGEVPPPDVHENAHLHPHSRGIARGSDVSNGGGSSSSNANSLLSSTALAAPTLPAGGSQALANQSAGLQAKAVLLARVEATPTKAQNDQRQTRVKMAEARMKGYEGDPCGACGAFTLVRNGICLKCISCGGTSGCS